MNKMERIMQDKQDKKRDNFIFFILSILYDPLHPVHLFHLATTLLKQSLLRMIHRPFLIAVGIGMIVFSGCQNSETSPITVFSGNAMVMNYKLSIGKPINNQEKVIIEKIIRETFEEIDLTYNRWNPNSELSKLNKLHAGEKVIISSELAKFLLWTGEIVTLTDGKFDPTVDPLCKVWKSYLELGILPPPKKLEKIIPAVGWKNIHIENNLFWKDNDLTAMDLGGIAKGLCVDMMVEKLNQAGFANVCFEWGGEIRASGMHPQKRPWTIFISRLGDTDPTHSVANVPLNNQSIATSGDYQQFWTLESQNITYTHIIDPISHFPITVNEDKIASTSVVASNCAFADALATTFMLFDNIEQAREWGETLQKKHPEISFWLLQREKDRPPSPQIPR
jgi:thiamine biosynthesis lipoprotein